MTTPAAMRDVRHVCTATAVPDPRRLWDFDITGASDNFTYQAGSPATVAGQPGFTN